MRMHAYMHVFLFWFSLLDDDARKRVVGHVSSLAFTNWIHDTLV